MIMTLSQMRKRTGLDRETNAVVMWLVAWYSVLYARWHKLQWIPKLLMRLSMYQTQE